MKVTFNMTAAKEKIENAGQKAVFIVTQQALKDCNYYCKQDTSELINSSILHSDFENGRLVWQTPYARYQYYLDNTRKDKNPNACKMWAHAAHAKHKKEWFDMMEKAFRKFAKE